MLKSLPAIILLLAMLLPAPGLFAQEDGQEPENAADTVQSGVEGAEKAPEPAMSVGMSAAMPVADATLDLAGGTVYATMTAGVCPVVDDLVQQYCSANPDDISCQFQ